jgi:hypothetical protein
VSSVFRVPTVPLKIPCSPGATVSGRCGGLGPRACDNVHQHPQRNKAGAPLHRQRRRPARPKLSIQGTRTRHERQLHTINHTVPPVHALRAVAAQLQAAINLRAHSPQAAQARLGLAPPLPRRQTKPFIAPGLPLLHPARRARPEQPHQQRDSSQQCWRASPTPAQPRSCCCASAARVSTGYRSSLSSALLDHPCLALMTLPARPPSQAPKRPPPTAPPQALSPLTALTQPRPP